jgi:hypothetical protein
MRKEGFLTRNLNIHGVWMSSFLYAVLADEWTRAVSEVRAGASGNAPASQSDVEADVG